MKRFLALSIVGFTTLAAAFASAELSVGADASGKADAEGADAEADAKAEGSETETAPEGETSDTAEPAAEEDAAEAKAEEEKEDAEGPKSEEDADKDADTQEGKTTYGSDEIAFGGVYTFGQVGGRTMGIPHGSLAGISHGLHSDYRRSGLMLSGDTWIDTGYRSTETDLPTTSDGDESEFTQQGRFMLRATPTYSKGNWFAKAQGEILALSDAPNNEVVVDVDDAWVMFGYWDLFDVQFGRFEAWEVYHKGMGLERNTLEDQGATPADHDRGIVVDMYEVNHALYRQGPLGQVALHAYPFDFLRFEVEGIVGIDVERTTRCPVEPNFRPALDAAGMPTGPTQPRQSCIIPWGIRPAAIVDFDFVKVKGAYERVGLISRQETDAETSALQLDELREGFGGGVQFILDPHIEVGGAFAQGTSDLYDGLGVFSPTGSVERTTFGGFLNARLEIISPLLSGFVVGGGFNQTNRLSQDCGAISVRDPVTGNPVVDPATGMPQFRDGCEEQAHTQFFAAIQHDILERATFKVVLGMADADINYGPSGTRLDEKTNMFSIRTRALIWY